MNFKKTNGKGCGKSFYKSLIICFIFFISIANLLQEHVAAKNRFCELYIINSRNARVYLNAELAETDESRSRGLMYRNKLEDNSGMLFVFSDESIQEFWMKNTYIPLDIAYIGRSGVINEIYYMKPLDTTVTYPSKKPSMFVLEVNKNWFKNNNITEGCRIYFNGCVGK